MTMTTGPDLVLAHRDNRLLAAAFLCSAVFCATSQDSLMKYLSGGYPIHELLAIRSVVAVPILAAIILSSTGLASLAVSPRHLGPVLLRGSLLFAGFISFALAFAAMPLADVVTIYFTMPFIVAALSARYLGERVGLARWLAIAAGFLGVFIMLQKDSSLSDPASYLAGFARPGALLAFLSASCYATGQMMARPLSRHVPPVVMSFYQNLIHLGACLVFATVVALVPMGGSTDKSLAFLLRTWVVPPTGDLPIIVAIAVLGSFAMPLFSMAYKHAEASYVAPFEYTAMFWAVLYGLLVFGDVPGPATLIGAGIVIAAGLFMIAADRRRLGRGTAVS